MSYILGALKKAEKDRRQERSLNLRDWDQEPWDTPAKVTSGNSILLWILSFVLVIVLVLFVWLAYRVIGTMEAPVETSTQLENIPPYEEVEQHSLIVTDPQPEVSQQKNSIHVDSSSVVSVRVPDSELASQVAAQSVDKETNVLPIFSGHIYFTGNARLSRVFSGSESYREGDLVDGYRVQSILEKTVILSRNGQEFQADLNN